MSKAASKMLSSRADWLISARTAATGCLVVALLSVAGCGGGSSNVSTSSGANPNSAIPQSAVNAVAMSAVKTSGHPTNATSCRPATDSGSVAYWSFDNISSATAFNTKFDGFNVTLNSVSVVPGVVGQALQFDSSLSESYGEIPILEGTPNSGAHFPDNRISVAMWIKPSKVEAGATYNLFGGGYYGSQSFHVRLVNGKVTLVLNPPNTGGSSEDTIIESTTPINPGQWQHIAVTYDGLIARVYINGVLDVEKNIAHTVSDVYNSLYIGGLPNTLGEATMTFPGAIDELQLTNTTLTASDVLSLAKLTVRP